MWRSAPSEVKRILVTGGAGFIGSNFVDLVLEKEPLLEVDCLDSLTYAGNVVNLEKAVQNPRFRFIQADILDHNRLEDQLGGRGYDWVFNFAAETHVDRSIHEPRVTVGTNVMGTLNLLEFFRARWAGQEPQNRFIHISTDEVFGSIEKGSFSEGSRYAPSSPYSASKAASDHLVGAYYHTFGFPGIVTQCTNNYGPRQHPEKLIPLMILHANEGKKLPIYGDGGQWRDWLFVQDHCVGVWLAATNGEPGRSYCLSGGQELTNLEIVHLIIEELSQLTGEPINKLQSLITHVQDRPGHDRRYALDSALARKELGWKPVVPFQEGFRETVRWYLSHLDWCESVQNTEYAAWLKTHYHQGQCMEEGPK